MSTDCEDVRALAAEAALGLLDGAERARVLSHLDECEECRQLVRGLSTSAEELVLLAPSVEPPVGFEQRVLGRLTDASRRRRRWPVVAAAAALVLLLAGGVFAFTSSRRAEPNVAELTMRTPSGAVVGDAYLHRSDPAWVFVAVPYWTEPGSGYQMRVTLADGSTLHVRGPEEASARAGWGSTIQVPGSAVREIALVGDDGRVWCSASV